MLTLPSHTLLDMPSISHTYIIIFYQTECIKFSFTYPVLDVYYCAWSAWTWGALCSGFTSHCSPSCFPPSGPGDRGWCRNKLLATTLISFFIEVGVRVISQGKVYSLLKVLVQMLRNSCAVIGSRCAVFTQQNAPLCSSKREWSHPMISVNFPKTDL